MIVDTLMTRRSKRLLDSCNMHKRELDRALDDCYTPNHIIQDQIINDRISSLLHPGDTDLLPVREEQNVPFFLLNADVWGKVLASTVTDTIRQIQRLPLKNSLKKIRYELLSTLRAFSCTHHVMYALLRKDGPLASFVLLGLTLQFASRFEFKRMTNGLVDKALHALYQHTMRYVSNAHLLMVARYTLVEQEARNRCCQIDIDGIERSFSRVKGVQRYLKGGFYSERPTLLSLPAGRNVGESSRWTDVQAVPTRYLGRDYVFVHTVEPTQSNGLPDRVNESPYMGLDPFKVKVQANYRDLLYFIDPRDEYLVSYKETIAPVGEDEHLVRTSLSGFTACCKEDWEENGLDMSIVDRECHAVFDMLWFIDERKHSSTDACRRCVFLIRKPLNEEEDPIAQFVLVEFETNQLCRPQIGPTLVSYVSMPESMKLSMSDEIEYEVDGSVQNRRLYLMVKDRESTARMLYCLERDRTGWNCSTPLLGNCSNQNLLLHEASRHIRVSPDGTRMIVSCSGVQGDPLIAHGYDVLHCEDQYPTFFQTSRFLFESGPYNTINSNKCNYPKFIEFSPCSSFAVISVYTEVELLSNDVNYSLPQHQFYDLKGMDGRGFNHPCPILLFGSELCIDHVLWTEFGMWVVTNNETSSDARIGFEPCVSMESHNIGRNEACHRWQQANQQKLHRGFMRHGGLHLA